METLELLLHQPNINLNCKSRDFETPLLLSLRLERSDDFIFLLLEAGCNVNISNKDRETPLHLAVLRRSTKIARELIKKGAQIEAETKDEITPLRDAVRYNELESTCMLLYYGANVDVSTEDNRSPLRHALWSTDKLDILRLLIDYCDEFPFSNILAPIIHCGSLGSYNNYDTYHSLIAILLYDNAELFKLIWSKFIQEHLLLHENYLPFLRTYCMETSQWSAVEWVDCLYLLLESPAAFNLIQESTNGDYILYNYLKIGASYEHRYSFFCYLFDAFYEKQIESRDRITIINICLHFGAEVNIYDIGYACTDYGFSEEVEALIYSCNCNYTTKPDEVRDCFIYPLIIFLAVEDFSTEVIFKIFKEQMEIYQYIFHHNLEGHITSLLGFFSLSSDMKRDLANFIELHVNDDDVSEKLNKIPEMPSLVELSRNQARKFIKQTRKIKKIYEFHDAVKNLRLPQDIEDIIRFKKHIY